MVCDTEAFELDIASSPRVCEAVAEDNASRVSGISFLAFAAQPTLWSRLRDSGLPGLRVRLQEWLCPPGGACGRSGATIRQIPWETTRESSMVDSSRVWSARSGVRGKAQRRHGWRWRVGGWSGRGRLRSRFDDRRRRRAGAVGAPQRDGGARIGWRALLRVRRPGRGERPKRRGESGQTWEPSLRPSGFVSRTSSFATSAPTSSASPMRATARRGTGLPSSAETWWCTSTGGAPSMLSTARRGVGAGCRPRPRSRRRQRPASPASGAVSPARASALRRSCPSSPTPTRRCTSPTRWS